MPFQKISPPVAPLRGQWEHRETWRGRPRSSLTFRGSKVEYQETTRREGHWSADQKELHLNVPGESDSVIPFHFNCDELVFENPLETFRNLDKHAEGASPLVGRWTAERSNLALNPDHTFTDQRSVTQNGTFKSTPAGLTMRWDEPKLAGGAEWIGQIKKHHIVVAVNGVASEYHYLAPGWELDL